MTSSIDKQIFRVHRMPQEKFDYIKHKLKVYRSNYYTWSSYTLKWTFSNTQYFMNEDINVFKLDIKKQIEIFMTRQNIIFDMKFFKYDTDFKSIIEVDHCVSKGIFLH